MVRVTILGSGSKGNCTVVSTSRTRIVLDAGFSCREIVKRMRFCEEDPETLDAVLITHEHQDHVQGLSVLARRFRVPVYATQATHSAWQRWVRPRQTMSFNAWLAERREQAAAERIAEESGAQTATCAAEPVTAAVVEEPAVPLSSAPVHEALRNVEEEMFPFEPGCDDPAWLPAVEYFRAGCPFMVGDVSITPFTIPHDAADPVGFVLEAEGVRIAIATDLGYMPPNVRLHLRRSDLLMLESNYDVEMLREGPYPWSVKQRVQSRVGHLSNEAAGEYLAGEYDGDARYVILAHISESNNLPELARITAERALGGRMSLLGNRVLLASQSAPLESIYL